MRLPIVASCLALTCCGEEPRLSEPDAATIASAAPRSVDVAPLTAAFGTLLGVTTEDSLRQARDLLGQIEPHVDAAQATALRDQYEQALIRLGESRARVNDSAAQTSPVVEAPRTGTVTAVRERQNEVPVPADTVQGNVPSQDVLARIETRRRRTELIERSLQEIANERLRRLREDVEYRRQRSQGKHQPSQVPVEEQVREHLQGRFEQAIHQRDPALGVACLEDLRLLNPEADLMHNYLALRAMQDRLSAGGSHAAGGLAALPSHPGANPPGDLGFNAASETRTLAPPAGRGPTAAAGMDAAAAQGMLDGALVKLRSAGPEGEEMANALSAFVASGGKDQRPLQEALSSFRELQAASGSQGGAMGGMLEQMLGQLTGNGGQSGGSTPDLSAMLGMLGGGGGGLGASGSPDLQALQKALSGMQSNSSKDR